MTGSAVMPSADPTSGLWAASRQKGLDAERVWVAASLALAKVFRLQPADVRAFLDSDAGWLLSEDLMFIDGDPASSDAIEALIWARLDHLGWRRLYAEAIAQVRAGAGAGDAEG